MMPDAAYDLDRNPIHKRSSWITSRWGVKGTVRTIATYLNEEMMYSSHLAIVSAKTAIRSKYKYCYMDAMHTDNSSSERNTLDYS